jgi:hypothetical protein
MSVSLVAARAALVQLAVLAAAATGAPAAAQLSLPPDYAWRQLSPAGEFGSSVSSVRRIDPRGEWVVFVGDVENDGSEAVYAMRRNGVALHRLSAFGAPGTIYSLELSGDGRRVVYRGDLETNGRDELWSAPLPGAPGSAVKLNIPVTGTGVLEWSIPGSGDRLIYRAETAAGRGLWSVPIAGPAAAGIRLDPEVEPGEELAGQTISPDGARAVLLLWNTSLGVTRIWSVPTAGPVTSGLFLLDDEPNGCLAFGGASTISSARFLYFMQCETANGPKFNQVWSVPLAGPAADAESLAGSFVAGGGIDSIAFDPAHDRLVFIADKSVDERFDLWSVDVGGTSTSLTRLNPTPVAGGDVVSAVVSPDGARVGYVADQASNESFRAWSVPIAGPSTEAVPLVSGIAVSGSDVTDLQFTSDSDTVVYRADLSQNDRFDLYSVPADGSETQERITNDEGIPGADRSTGALWRLHPDGNRVAFTVDVSAPGDQRRLYEQRLSPRYIQDARLNDEPVAGGKVAGIEIYPDGAGTLYYSNELDVDEWHLFSVDARIFGDGFEEGTAAAWGDSP